MDKLSNQILALNLETLQWTKIGELPHGICAHCSEIVNDTIYIFAGCDGEKFLTDLYLFSLTNLRLYRGILTEEEIK